MQNFTELSIVPPPAQAFMASQPQSGVPPTSTVQPNNAVPLALALTPNSVPPPSGPAPPYSATPSSAMPRSGVPPSILIVSTESIRDTGTLTVTKANNRGGLRVK